MHILCMHSIYVLNIVQDDEISIAYEQFGCIIIHVTQLPCSNETLQTTTSDDIANEYFMPKVVLFPHEAKKTEFQQLKAHLKEPLSSFVHRNCFFFKTWFKGNSFIWNARETKLDLDFTGQFLVFVRAAKAMLYFSTNPPVICFFKLFLIRWLSLENCSFLHVIFLYGCQINFTTLNRSEKRQFLQIIQLMLREEPWKIIDNTKIK